jgi:hypothetical protein
MKKLIFANNEEKKIIRHLHESVKRQYLNLNEQTTYYKGSDGKVGVLNGPLALPIGAVKIDKSEYDKRLPNIMGNVYLDNNPFATTTTNDEEILIDTAPVDNKIQNQYVPQKPKPNPIVTELQTNLNTKFSSGLVEDGYLGQKTRNAIYDALTKGSQQTTQQTITVPQQVKSDGGTPNDDN